MKPPPARVVLSVAVGPEAQQRRRGRVELLHRRRHPRHVGLALEQRATAVEIAHIDARERAGAAHLVRELDL
jgi:hypothetical protein